MASRAGIGASIGLIFIFDIIIAPDDVSIAFAYVLPIFVSIVAPGGNAYLVAALTTTLSLVGLAAIPPDAGASFYGNRGIAILTQWIAAALVASRQKAERFLQQNLEAERQKAEQQQRFLDIVSHEIGTSLTTIDGQAYRLFQRSMAAEPAETAERSGKIRGAVRHIQALLRHIQLVAEAEDKTLQPQRENVSLAELIEDVVAQVRKADRQAAIAGDLSALPDTIRLDPFMTRQIVENIVSNAVKYSPAGAPVTVRAEAAGDEIRLIVADQGRGIPEEEIASVFSVYYRCRNSHDVHGTGVGLYVAERFASALGGRIALESRVGIGTTVTLHLPYDAPEGLR